MSSGKGARSSLTAAYAACERLARQHYENFPVASLLLPGYMRPHVAAVYAYARIADDFADEGDRPAAERQWLLDDWLKRLHSAAAHDANCVPPAGSSAQQGEDQHALMFVALADTIRKCRLPIGLFEDLVAAFRQDTVKTRYGTYDELLEYCRCSANPVGRLVLRIAGHHDDREMDLASDKVCTALQLTNFWQDLGRDWKRGRLYVPLDELREAGASESDLDRRTITPAWESVMASLAERTRSLFAGGRPVADRTRGRLALELRLTWLGGMRILDRVEEQRFDVFTRRPTLSKRDMPAILWQAVIWGR